MNVNSTTAKNEARLGQELLNDVVRLFTELLVSSGATQSMISHAMALALAQVPVQKMRGHFEELGSLQRDCMEVMCAWRRNPRLVDCNGEPKPLDQERSPDSFQSLCLSAGCTHAWLDILRALLEFGAVSINENDMVVSRTPTFLLTRVDDGGRLATDGLLKQLEGYLRVVHRNVLSISGSEKPRFERACTVAVAVELEPIFDQLVRTRGQEFVDSIDEWLERNARRESACGRYVELGAGVYFIDLGESARRARARQPTTSM